ncbi:endolytic transglycosylase MltG [Actinomyces sp. zg-332]|uniref:endolytic transglycosylase MltG n=1 Tax=Actinomyces sp. zg-332 TaxID=2708340 RepID=UPI0014219672|nr:endolytic transglycosylase MltG [Actinomyces sp. zg-332]QPK94609.1 endolytic transglycosylase MltG [Actinomyces sp. zg-332]
MDNTNRYPSRRAAHSVRKKKKHSKLVIPVVFVFILFAAFFSYTFLKDSLFAPSDYAGPGTGTVKVTIHNNETGTDIANSLYNAKVVASTDVFIKAFTSNAASVSIQPGVYKLKKQMRAVDAVAALLDPKNKIDLKITIPEGFALEQVIKRIVKVAGFSEKDIRDVIANPNSIDLPEEANGNLEGWIAPKTYTISPDDKPVDVLKSMVAITKKTLEDLKVPHDKWKEILTKASIIEREVNQDKYYPMVARVIENRISSEDNEVRGKLQMDSTVLYGLGKFGGIPTADEIAKDTPYNTYIHTGLPPTPIGAVSEKAIKAAMSPSDGNWLYFVTVDLNTGETLFASTLDEQKANTEKLKEFCKTHADVCQ